MTSIWKSWDSLIRFDHPLNAHGEGFRNYSSMQNCKGV